MLLPIVEWLDALMGKRYVVRLSDPDRGRAVHLTSGGGVPAQVRTRAAVLLAAHAGQSDQQIAARLATSVTTVQRTRRRYATAGFAAAVGWAGDGAAAGREPVAAAWVAGALARSGPIDGVVGVALADIANGSCLWKGGDGTIDMDAAAAGNAVVVRTKLDTIDRLCLRESIEDILITLSTQYHLIRVLATGRSHFLYAVLDRASGNLAMARHRLEAIERGLTEHPPGSEQP